MKTLLVTLSLLVPAVAYADRIWWQVDGAPYRMAYGRDDTLPSGIAVPALFGFDVRQSDAEFAFACERIGGRLDAIPRELQGERFLHLVCRTREAACEWLQPNVGWSPVGQVVIGRHVLQGRQTLVYELQDVADHAGCVEAWREQVLTRERPAARVTYRTIEHAGDLLLLPTAESPSLSVQIREP